MTCLLMYMYKVIILLALQGGNIPIPVLVNLFVLYVCVHVVCV